MIDLVRRRRTRRDVTAQGPLENDEDVATALEQLAVYRKTPSQSAAAHEFMAALETVMSALPGAYQDVITYRHLHGLSAVETAERMNRDIDSIYVLTSRALKAIRERMQSASRW